jgi:hypothetical protein
MTQRRAGSAGAELYGSERSRVQQVARVAIADQAAFHQYAEQLGLQMSTLATLLLARELRIRRLSRLGERHRAVKGASLDGKIIAYLHGSDVKRSFSAHAASAEMRPGPAAALIFRAELTERWLERVIGTC